MSHFGWAGPGRLRPLCPVWNWKLQAGKYTLGISQDSQKNSLGFLIFPFFGKGFLYSDDYCTVDTFNNRILK
jgi:hypothetical protein